VGGPVLIRLGGVAGQFAIGQLSIQVTDTQQYASTVSPPPPPPANDVPGYDCASAALLTMFSGESSRQAFNFTNHVRSSAATTCGGSSQADYWFLVSGLAANDQVFLSICKAGAMPTSVTVYASCGGREIACFTFDPASADCESKKDSFTSTVNNFFIRIGGTNIGSNPASYMYYQVGQPSAPPPSVSSSSSGSVSSGAATSTSSGSAVTPPAEHSGTEHPVLIGFLVVFALIIVGGAVGGFVYWKKFRQNRSYQLTSDDDNSVGVY